MRRTVTTLLALALASVLGAACNGETTGTIGSETNWLASCTENDHCVQGQCLCGVCTEACTPLTGCNDGTLICASNQSPAYGKLCAEQPRAPEGVCLTPCDGTSCPLGNHCEGDACVPDPPPPPPQRCVGGNSSSCDLAQADATCLPDGLCAIAACDYSYGDCNEQAKDGCETNLEAGDYLNCGQCGNSCDIPMPYVDRKMCADYQCGIEACQDDRFDCDSDVENGCEISADDLLTDEDNCGECGTECDSGEQCVDGSCEPGSNPGAGGASGDAGGAGAGGGGP